MKLFYSLLLGFFLVVPGWTQNSKDLITAMTRTEKSAAVIRQFAALGSDSVPVEYLQKAKAVAVFPDLTKVNILLSELIIGNGMVCLRASDKWSVPVFLAFKGTDTNLKIAGKKSFDTVFLLMTDESVEWLKKGDLRFASGSKSKAMLGPVIGGQGTDRTIEQASLIYYTFDKGQLVDTNLSNDTYFKAFGILQDNNMNKSIFGMRTRALFAASEESVKVPSEIEKFRSALMEISAAAAIPLPARNETTIDQ